MKALVARGKVAQIVADEAVFPSCCEWITIPAELDPQPEVGWTYADNTFTEPTPPDLPIEQTPDYMTLEQQVKNAYDGMVLLAIQYLAQVENATLEGVQANLASYTALANQLRDLKNPMKVGE